MSGTPRRYLAPAAIVAVAVAAVLIVSNGTGGSSSRKVSSTPTTVLSHRPAHRTYRVRNGDSLSAIAARSGVTTSQLEQLNPGLDPNALRPGQRIRLRP